MLAISKMMMSMRRNAMRKFLLSARLGLLSDAGSGEDSGLGVRGGGEAGGIDSGSLGHDVDGRDGGEDAKGGTSEILAGGVVGIACSLLIGSVEWAARWAEGEVSNEIMLRGRGV